MDYLFRYCHHRDTVNLAAVVPEIVEHSVRALSEGLGSIGEPEIFKFCGRVLGTVEHQILALAVVRIVQYDALFLSAVDVDYYQ